MRACFNFVPGIQLLGKLFEWASLRFKFFSLVLQNLGSHLLDVLTDLEWCSLRVND